MFDEGLTGHGRIVYVYIYIYIYIYAVFLTEETGCRASEKRARGEILCLTFS